MQLFLNAETIILKLFSKVKDAYYSFRDDLPKHIAQPLVDYCGLKYVFLISIGHGVP